MTLQIKPYIWLVVLAAMNTQNALAIDLDRSKPIVIESDSAVIDDTEGLSTYRGNVVISQGTTELKADNITVFAKERNLTQIIANGSPATFRQQDLGSEAATTGKAEQITYQAEDALLVFTGSASLSQETNSFSGDRIEYDIMRKAIRAKGDEDTGSRVRIQYFPSSASEEPGNQTNKNSDTN